MSRRMRMLVLGPALLGLGALFAWAIAGLPAFGDYRGPYGFVLNRVVVPLRHTTNVVMGTTFDVRGVDTMGEEFILFAAVIGVTLLLREEAEESRAERNTRRLRSDATRLIGILFVGVGVLVGLWLIARVAGMAGISSVQITFDEDKPPEQHAMPPGGFRVAIVKCGELAAGRAGRELLRQHFLAQGR